MTKKPASTSLSELYRRPGFLLRRAHQISAAIFESECAEWALTPAQFGVLTVLGSSPGLDQTTLARALAFDKVTVLRVLRGLEERGLIERAVSQQSRRQMAVKLSAAGVELLSKAQPSAHRAYDRLVEPLTREQRERLIEVLEALTEGLSHEARAPFAPLTTLASSTPRRAAL